MYELYDFTFSHYSEKARWALDFKGVAYTPRHLLPGFHLRTTRKLRSIELQCGTESLYVVGVGTQRAGASLM